MDTPEMDGLRTSRLSKGSAPVTHGAARRAPAGLRDGAARRLQLVLAIVLTLGAILGATAAAASGQVDPVGRRSVTLGHSVDGRPITAIES